MRFYHQFVFAQFWACVDFKDASVLTARGQPFGISMYTNEFWLHREACSGQNSYVDNNKNLCIGLPGRVFLNQFPAYDNRGLFFMPVIEGDQCIGVLELALPNFSPYEMREVCRALEEAGLKSSVHNENINYYPSEDYSQTVESKKPTGSRKSKSDKITLNDITKVFGLPKSIATKICGLSSENTFSEVHRRFGLDTWPCIRSGIAKSSAHNALIKHVIASPTSSYEDLMQDNDNINFEDNLVAKYMDYLISKETADGKRVREQPDESDGPALLELYQHKNKKP